MASPFIPELSVAELLQAFPHLKDIDIIKSGGEGTVVKSFNPSLSVNTAIKIYASSHLKTRTELEVQKLSKIDNPYITTLYNYGYVTLRNEKSYFTETSYVNGKDLRNLLNLGKKFTVSEVIDVISCISYAIEALWKQRVVHCDIKPDNILFSNSQYILIDLGMAKHLDTSSITAAGMIMGTLGYLAPEQFKGRRNLTLKADYYALGITAYELLAGNHPFNRDQMLMLTTGIKSFPLGISVPEKLKNLIYSMTDPLPYNRPKNHQEIYNILKEI